MEKFTIRPIHYLLLEDISPILKQSKEEGFRFVERLADEYRDGTNTFNGVGEALYGVFNESGALVAIGGVNSDPFSNKPNIGRLRRFYVSKEFRRSGVGSLLLKNIINEAKNHYRILVLNTDTEGADTFYTSYGFTKSSRYPHSTHYLMLEE